MGQKLLSRCNGDGSNCAGCSTTKASNFVVLEGVAVPLLALDDLLTNKRAVGRPQDLAEPFDFEEAFGHRFEMQFAFGLVSVASIPDLIALKRKAGRPKDLLDILELEKLGKN